MERLPQRALERMKPGVRGNGLFVVLVGPDGSGKSSLAAGLVELATREGRLIRHMHWRPGILPQAGTVVGSTPGDPSRPHARQPHGPLVSLLRLAYYWIDFILGLRLRVLPIRARGGLVVMERGWWDFAVDPFRYRLEVSPRLVHWLARGLPSPDLVIFLEAAPGVLTGRKRELPAGEVARQLRLWRQIRFPRETRRVVLDASRSLESLVKKAAGLITEMLGDVKPRVPGAKHGV